MKCENCDHELLEPNISKYCTNCGKLTGNTHEKSAPIAPPTAVLRGKPKFAITEWNAAFFPIIASIIPVMVLSYFAAGTAAAVVLTLIDILLSFYLYFQAPTYQFFDDRLRIFQNGRMVREIEYFQMKKIGSPTIALSDQKYDGSFIISTTGGLVGDFEIPSNPINSELEVDLIRWLSSKISPDHKLPVGDE